jgi:hypothetical protein
MISDCSSEITMTCLLAPQQITLLTLPDLTLGIEAASPGDRRSLQTLSCACGGSANTCGSRLDSIADQREESVGNTHMQIFYDLHVIRRNYDTKIAKRLHFAALKTTQAYGERASLASRLQAKQDIGRIPAAADCQRDIAALREVSDLLGENQVVRGVVRPSCEQGQIVGQRHDSEALLSIAIHARALAQIASKMGSQGCASAISEYIDAAAILESVIELLCYLFDLGMRNRRKHSGEILEITR